ncbi:hypothetical protein [Enterococcus hirae]|uniref:glycoside hydrolase family 78 protein n=1 Tax=Enterococcus hirae TaxID=1354 RepID=UPI00136DD84D|nr:hypothetical protein [Enterococcus hirae]NAE18087.1 hypothetical protein [Enterococcus hirae]
MSATISYVGAGAPYGGGNVSSQSVTLGRPNGVVAGDLLVAVINGSGGTGGSGYVAPSGWMRLASTASPYVHVYTKVATSSEPSSYTFTDTSGSGYYPCGVVLAYRGAAVTSITATVRSGTTCAAPSVTTVQPNSWVVFAWGASQATALKFFDFTGTPPMQRFNSAASSAIQAPIQVADVAQATTGASISPTAGVSDPTSTAAVTFVLQVANTAPNAATLASPPTNTSIDRTVAQRFSWLFLDSDAGDTQSRFDLQYRVQGEPTWTTVTTSTPNTFCDFAAATFASGSTYEWQVRTYDALGLQGPWSSSSFFTARTPQSAPTITSPIGGQAMSATPAVVAWSEPGQDAFQVRRVGDDAGSAVPSTVYWESGTVADATARSFAVPFDTNSRPEHLQVRVLYQGLWSAWADVRVLVAFTPPPIPVVTLSPDPDRGRVLVQIMNPAPAGGQPALAYNEVWVDDGNGLERRATALPAGTAWVYPTPVSGRDYTGNVQVRAVAQTGAMSTGVT